MLPIRMYIYIHVNIVLKYDNIPFWNADWRLLGFIRYIARHRSLKHSHILFVDIRWPDSVFNLYFAMISVRANIHANGT